MTAVDLVQLLGGVLQADELITDPAECRAAASDVYSEGTALAVVRATDKLRLVEAVKRLGTARIAMVPRGGGMSYTGGYVPGSKDCVMIDMSALRRIIAINTQDMYITVEAGVTWKMIHESLRDTGYRLACFGTFSGAQATVGGGMSNGALFLGSARYGTAADSLLGMEILLADGTLLPTGQSAFKNVSKPFYRTYGPDLAGLFVHDAGVLGIKTEVTLNRSTSTAWSTATSKPSAPMCPNCPTCASATAKTRVSTSCRLRGSARWWRWIRLTSNAPANSSGSQPACSSRRKSISAAVQ